MSNLLLLLLVETMLWGFIIKTWFHLQFIYTFLSVQDDQFTDIPLLFRKVSWCSPVRLVPSHLIVSCVAVLKKALNAVLLSFKMVDFDGGWRRKLIFIYFIYLIKHGRMFFCMHNNANNGPPLSTKRSEVLLKDRDLKLRG